MSIPDILLETIGISLKSIGFQRKSSTWHLSLIDVVEVFNIQKSSYSKKYYFNIGFLVSALSDEKHPKENHCHINFRATTLFENSAKLIEELLDFDNDKSDADRFEGLSSFSSNVLLPFFMSINCLKDVVNKVRPVKNKILIHKEVKFYFNE